MAHKLLLADDSVTIQRVIELTFADEDIHVIAVGDGKQAIDRVQTERPDIVLADVGMPERDGYEVAAFIKGNPQFAHIPVLLLTGAFEPIDEGRARGAGCDGVLVKPFEPQMVINRVKDLLAGRRPAGLWTNPAAQAPARPAAPAAPADLDLKRGAPQLEPGQPPADALDDYFDRLDAAFATVGGTETPRQPPAPASAPPAAPPPPREVAKAPEPPTARRDDLANWDPDLTGDPARPASIGAAGPQAAGLRPPEARPPASPPAVAPPSAAAPVPSPAAAAPPSLAEAFAALLAAEQGQAVAPSTARAESSSPPAASPVDTSEMVDDIVRRVIERMSDQAVQRTVVDVAERLVREEIERIKSSSR